jgi:adenylate cyclase
VTTTRDDPPTILVVDDNGINRDMLARHLLRQGYQIAMAENGRQALEMLRAQPFDLMLLDIMMPGMTGYDVLERCRTDPSLPRLPIIVISAVDEIESVARCIELGAEDYLLKPFSRVLLRARIGASLEKKRLHDQEQAYLEQIRAERARSEALLLNILPGPVAARLKQEEKIIADRFEAITVLFADIVGFTGLWSRRSPAELVEYVNGIFCDFDQLTEQHGLEKIKTIGDAYMAAGGLPTPREDHVEAVAELALDIRDLAAATTGPDGRPLRMRIGIDTGPVVAGVIGRTKFSYDLWGDTVNTADRMQAYGVPDRIQVTENVYLRLRDKYDLEERGVVRIKGKGRMRTYFLQGRK